LKKQSLDIFIPSLKIAIEYQGIQHYKPVEYFGDDQSYEERQKRDQLKKQLCEQNDIRLIEWVYNDPISEIVVKQKLNLIDNNNYNENLESKLVELKNIEIKKTTTRNHIITEINENINRMCILINKMENLKEENPKIVTNEVLLWYEAALSNHLFNLQMKKDANYKKYDLNLLNSSLKTSYYHLDLLQKDILYLRKIILKEKQKKDLKTSNNTSQGISDILTKKNKIWKYILSFISRCLSNFNFSGKKEGK